MRFRSSMMLPVAAILLASMSATAPSIAAECCANLQARALAPFSPRRMPDGGARIRRVVCDIQKDRGYAECIRRCELIEDGGARDDCWYSCNIRFGCGPR